MSRLLKMNSFVGVEFPDWYSVSFSIFIWLSIFKSIYLSECNSASWQAFLRFTISWRVKKTSVISSWKVQLENRFSLSIFPKQRAEIKELWRRWPPGWILQWRWKSFLGVFSIFILYFFPHFSNLLIFWHIFLDFFRKILKSTKMWSNFSFLGFVYVQQFIFEAFMTLKNNLTVDLKSIPSIELRVRGYYHVTSCEVNF